MGNNESSYSGLKHMGWHFVNPDCALASSHKVAAQRRLTTHAQINHVVKICTLTLDLRCTSNLDN